MKIDNKEKYQVSGALLNKLLFDARKSTLRQIELANIQRVKNCSITDVSGSFFLVQERKPEKDGEYDVITKRGRLIKANFIKGDKIGLDRWTCKSEDHRLNEGVMAWGYPINYR